MKKYTFLLLLMVLAAALLFGCGRRSEQIENEADSELTVQNTLTGDHIVADDDVTYLEYCNGQITLRFLLDETGVWRWADEPSFPLDSTLIGQILTALQEYSPTQTFPTYALDALGLNDPQKYLTFESEELSGTLYIGDQAEDGSWYVMLDGADHAHTIPDDFVRLLYCSVYDMAVLPTLPAFTAENLLCVTVESGESRTFMRKVDGEWKGLSQQVTERADEVVETLANLQVTRCFDYMPSPQALQLTGFSTPTATITVEYLNSVNVETSLTITLGTLRSAEEGYYVTLSGDNTIYLIPSTQLSPLLVLLIYAN